MPKHNSQSAGRTAKLSVLLAHLEKTADVQEPMATWTRNRMRMIDALVSPDFLDLSARSAKIDFADAEETAEDRYSYFAPFTLQFWKLDEEEEIATSISAQDWLDAQPAECPPTLLTT